MEDQMKILAISGISTRELSQISVSGDMIAYVAGAGVVVFDGRSQRFLCAHKQELIGDKRTDSFGYSDDWEVVRGSNESQPGSPMKLPEESRLANKIRNISCICLSPDGKLLAVGESGYQPRVLLYSLLPDSTGSPFCVIQDHQFGVNHLRFSPNSRQLASLGFVNDGYLNIWNLDKKVSLLAANKCSSTVNLLVWQGSYLITLGLRHLKVWFVDEISSAKVEPLQGKNVLLNEHLTSRFIDCTLDEKSVLVLSDEGHLFELQDWNLKKLGQLNVNTRKIILDHDKLWFNNGHHLEFCALDDLKQYSDPGSIISLDKINDKLIYLTEDMQILQYDTVTRHITTLVSPLIQHLSGYDKCQDSLLVWSRDGSIEEYDTEMRTLVKVDTEPNCCAYHLDEVFVGDKEGNLLIYKNDELKHTFKIHESYVTKLKYFEIANHIFLVSIGRDRMIQILRKINDNWELYQTLSFHKGTLLDCLIYEDRLIVSSNDRTISVHKFDLSSGDDLELNMEKLNLDGEIKLEKIISEKAQAISIYKDELMVSTLDKNLVFYKLGVRIEKSRSLKLFNEQNEALSFGSFIRVDEVLYVIGNDKSVRSYQLSNGKQLSCQFVHSDTASIFALGDDLVTIGKDGCMFKWRVHTSVLESPRVLRKIKLESPQVSRTLDFESPKVLRKIKPMESPKRAELSSPRREVSPIRLRQSTLNRLSQSPKRMNRSGVEIFCDNIDKLESQIKLKELNEKDLSLVKSKITQLFQVLNEDPIEIYSERLLEVIRDKMGGN